MKTNKREIKKTKNDFKTNIEIRQYIVWPSLLRFAHTDLYNQNSLDKASNSDAFETNTWQ